MTNADNDLARSWRRLERDPIKAMLASAVQHHLITDPHERPALLPHPADVDSVEATATTATETLIRVKTHSHGTRYFTVKLAEML
jgi:hypothetical protein